MIALERETMSRFYASISGSAKTEATRRGSGKSGIQGHIRGRFRGIRVTGGINLHTGNDVFYVWVTGGSYGHDRDSLLVIVEENGTVHKGEVDFRYDKEYRNGESNA
jgi:hypothetical protein